MKLSAASITETERDQSFDKVLWKVNTLPRVPTVTFNGLIQTYSSINSGLMKNKISVASCLLGVEPWQFCASSVRRIMQHCTANVSTKKGIFGVYW